MSWAWWATAIPIALVVLDIVLRVLAVIFVPRNRRPQTAAAWLLLIFFIPEIGVILFLLLGSRHLPRRRRRKQQRINEYITQTTAGIEQVHRVGWPGWLGPLVELNRELGAMPLVGGSCSSMVADNYEALRQMAEDIDGATKLVHCEFYILLLDETTEPFFDALERAQQRGVDVRVMLDHLGSFGYPGYFRTVRRLKRMGVKWQLMLPIQPWRGRFQRPDLRNHRKILVIDGEIGWTGSMNVVDPSYQRRGNKRRGLQWRDYMARFEGPIVAGLDALFATDWYSETDELLPRALPQEQVRATGPLECQVVPSGPGFDEENNLKMFNSAIYAARRRLVICSPYFVPDDSLLYAITTAAQSGVEVQLFVGEIGDQFLVYRAQRSYYEELLRAGVRIFLYARPTILHAKHMTVDDELSVIGSSNMDMRSFSLDLEVSMIVRGGDFLQQLRAVEDDYRLWSRELDLATWLKRPWWSQILDNMARLTAALQ